MGALQGGMEKRQPFGIETAIDPFGHRDDQVVDIAEVIIDGADIGARALGNAAHGHLFGTAGGLEQFFAGDTELFGRRAFGHVTPGKAGLSHRRMTAM